MNGKRIGPDILSGKSTESGPRHRNKQKKVPKRISGSTLGRQASLTVEASLVLPLFLWFFAGFLYLIAALGMQEDMAQELSDQVRLLGRSSYSGAAADGKGMIERQSSRKIELPWILLGGKAFTLTQSQTCRAWIGFTGNEGFEETDELVFITPFGSVYHTRLDCRYLDLSIRAVSAKTVRTDRNYDGGRYAACSCCRGDEEMVYITNYGIKYHGDLTCSGLKRVIIPVSKSQVGGRPACHGCGD